MNNPKTYSAMFNYLEVELPADAVADCSHPGPCDDDVEFWQQKLNLNLDRELMIKELKEYGAYRVEQLIAKATGESNE